MLLMVTFVIVESPYAPKNHDPAVAAVELARNEAYLSAAMHDCFLRGEVPFASHGIYTRKGVLDDTKPEERKLGIEAGFKVAEGLQAAALALPNFFSFKRLFYTDRGYSSGMSQGLQDANNRNQVYEMRSLGEKKWSKDHDRLYYLDKDRTLQRFITNGDPT